LPNDALIAKAVRHWEDLALHGGKIEPFHQDLLELQMADHSTVEKHTKDYDADLVKLAEELRRRKLLPNLQFWGATKINIVVVDIRQANKGSKAAFGMLSDDHGMPREIDLDNAQKGVINIDERLFAHPGNPLQDIKPENATQGIGIPNCHFTATVSSMAQADPEALKNMVRQNKDHTFTVTFPGDPAHPQTVGAPDDWELETFAGGQSGVWANVIDKAYRKYKQLPFYNADGGKAREAEHLLTGKSAILVHPMKNCDSQGMLNIDKKDYNNGQAAVCPETLAGQNLEKLVRDGRFAPVSLSALPQLLSEAESKHYVVVTNTENDFKKFSKQSLEVWDSQGHRVLLEHMHDYTVIKYDPNKKTIIMRNPHGSNPDAVTGKQIGDGYINVPIAMMGTIFPSLEIGETSKTSK
jgi:hypothetical protein